MSSTNEASLIPEGQPLTALLLRQYIISELAVNDETGQVFYDTSSSEPEDCPSTDVFEVCQSEPVNLDELRALVDEDHSLLRQVDDDGKEPVYYLGRDQFIATDVLEYVAKICPDVLRIVPRAHGLTTLLEAFANGLSLDMLQKLMADAPSLTESEEWLALDPLHETISREKAQDDVILFLVQSFPDAVERGNLISRLPLHLACVHESSLAIVRALAEQYPEALVLPDAHGDLPLHMAVSAGRNGSDRRRRETTPGGSDNMEVIQYLTERNTEALIRANDEGQLPLHLACESGREFDCIRLLCENCPEAIEQQCGSGLYPLHCACSQKNYTPVIKYLAEKYNEAVRYKDEDGDLPLHILLRGHWSGALEDQLDAVKKLLAIYPEGIRTTNEEEDIPLHIACEYSWSLALIMYLVESFEEEGKSRNYEGFFGPQSVKMFGDNGSLPLHRACMQRKKRLDIIEYILNLNFDAVEQPDDEGNLPLHFLLNGVWQKENAKAREDLIRKMITLSPMSLDRTDENDMSFFSLACRWYAPPAVTEKLRGEYSPLHRVVEDEACMVTITRAAVLYPKPVRDRNESGELPLHAACRRGSPIEIIKTLYRRYPDAISVRDNGGNMPLHSACSHPRNATLEFLLSKYKAALRIPNFRGSLPMHILCEASPSSINLADIRLIAEGNKDALKRPDCDGSLPLHRYCARANSAPVLLYLINENPATCGMKDNRGNLPLHILTQNRRAYDTAIQSLTKKNKQALTTRNDDGLLPLHLYFSHRVNPYLSLVKCLSQRSFSRTTVQSQTTADGASFLHEASRGRASIEIIRYLLDRDPCIAPSSKDDHGRTPLHYAQDYETAYAIYSAFPDAISVRDNEGNTPLHLACSRAGSLEVIRCLWVCDEKSTMTRNNAGDLPLHLACQARANTEVVEFLIQQSASSVRTRGRDGQLPIHAWFREAGVYDHFADDLDGNSLTYLVSKYPNALQVRDFSGFFPVHLAHFCSTDLIYNLLLACPSVVTLDMTREA